jgi:hypothetical protein
MTATAQRTLAQVAAGAPPRIPPSTTEAEAVAAAGLGKLWPRLDEWQREMLLHELVARRCDWPSLSAREKKTLAGLLGFKVPK